MLVVHLCRQTVMMGIIVRLTVQISIVENTELCRYPLLKTVSVAGRVGRY